MLSSALVADAVSQSVSLGSLTLSALELVSIANPSRALAPSAVMVTGMHVTARTALKLASIQYRIIIIIRWSYVDS